MVLNIIISRHQVNKLVRLIQQLIDLKNTLVFITKYMDKTILYIQAIGWNKKEVANWSYRYYKFTFITNSVELLAYNGIYADTFGSVENIISKIREYNRSKENKKLDEDLLVLERNKK